MHSLDVILTHVSQPDGPPEPITLGEGSAGKGDIEGELYKGGMGGSGTLMNVLADMGWHPLQVLQVHGVSTTSLMFTPAAFFVKTQSLQTSRGCKLARHCMRHCCNAVVSMILLQSVTWRTAREATRPCSSLLTIGVLSILCLRSKIILRTALQTALMYKLPIEPSHMQR